MTTALLTKAAVVHTHAISDVTGLQTQLSNIETAINDIVITDGEDGISPTITVGTVLDGPVPLVEVDIASTPSNRILNFTLTKGDKGDPFAFDAIDVLSNRYLYNSENSDFVFLATDTGLYYVKNDTGWNDGVVFQGYNGWTPRLSLYTVSASIEIIEILGFLEVLVPLQYCLTLLVQTRQP